MEDTFGTPWPHTVATADRAAQLQTTKRCIDFRPLTGIYKYVPGRNYNRSPGRKDGRGLFSGNGRVVQIRATPRSNRLAADASRFTDKLKWAHTKGRLCPPRRRATSAPRRAMRKRARAIRVCIPVPPPRGVEAAAPGPPVGKLL